MNPIEQNVILDSISEGVFTVDAQWRITSFNRAAEGLTGITRAQALGQLCRTVFRTSVCDARCALRETLETGKTIHDRRIELVDADGKTHPVAVSTNLLRDSHGVVQGGVETFRDLSREEHLRVEARQAVQLGDLIGRSAAMRRVLDALPAIADSSATVLITGESGTGKELVARALHDLSPRRKKPFVAINCGAIPDPLLESELFGYKAGAFTDAKRDKPGRLAQAEGGTLFLDELGDLSSVMQVRLLRVLQERQYEPLGGTRTQTCDVRVVAATHRDLLARTASGEFREDLYYRIAVVPVHLPPLRDRLEDLPSLVERLLERIAAREGKSLPAITQDALGCLLCAPWPGNVRQVAQVLDRACVFARNTITRAHLGLEGCAQEARLPDSGGSLTQTSRQAEAAAMIASLREHQGNRTAAARALGIHKTTLLRKMKACGISGE